MVTIMLPFRVDYSNGTLNMMLVAQAYSLDVSSVFWKFQVEPYTFFWLGYRTTVACSDGV